MILGKMSICRLVPFPHDVILNAESLFSEYLQRWTRVLAAAARSLRILKPLW